MNTSPGRSPARAPVVEATIEDDEPTSRVVVTAVAAVADERVVDLPPLYEWVDPEALDALFPDETTGPVSFSYYGYLVVVTADGTVQVYEESTS
jgi:hypothetical protein